MDYALGYRWYDQNTSRQLLRATPSARPMGFGYGLSYSTFSYRTCRCRAATSAQNGVVNVTVDVTNTSERAGDEIVFLFVSYGHTTSPRRPLKELKAYKRVSLAGRNPADPDATDGHAKRITMPLRVKDLKYWDMASEQVGGRERRRARHRRAERGGRERRAGDARRRSARAARASTAR